MVRAPATSPSSGALAGVRLPEPAVDLAPLVRHLAAAVPRPSTPLPTFPATGRPFLTWDPDARALVLDTEAVLLRLRTSGGALQAMRAFLIDADVPKATARAHLGGVIRTGTEAALRDATGRLVAAIDAEIDRAIGDGFDPALLSTTPAAAVLDTLGQRVKLDPSRVLQGPTRLSRVRLETVPETRARRRDEVARVMDAVEDVDGTRATHRRNFFASVERRLLAEGYTPRRVAAALQYHQHNAEASGTQLARFFDFLENEALSRVRLHVGSHLMEALGAEAAERQHAGVAGDWSVLVAYIRRATGLLEALSTAETPALRLNLSADFGQDASFNLRDQVITAGFMTGLPVWPEWNTQMFEEEAPPASSSSGPNVTRELTYRFRVNGIVPETGQPSYDTRLERIEKDWLRLTPGPGEPAARELRVNRSLAELVFLWAAVPSDDATPPDPVEALAATRILAGRLEEGGKPALRQALGELRARSGMIQRVARSLIALLRETGTVLTGSVSGRRWDYYLNVLSDLVNLQRIGAELDEPLVATGQGAPEQVDFLRHLWITRDQGLPGAVLSVRVQVRLRERSLSTIGTTATLVTRRRPPDTLMQVVWRPPTSKRPGVAPEDSWLVSPRIEIGYDIRTVRWPEGKAAEPRALYVLAATRSALAILVHLTLLRLIQRAEAASGRRPTLSVLRLQEHGRGAADLGGDEGVYAAAQAVEIALAREVDLRMQGLAFDSPPRDARYKERGAYTALFAGFPLQMSQPDGERPPIGVVTYATRPCAEHPDLPDASGRNLVLARTYLATPIEAPFAGYDVRTLGSRTELGDPAVALPDTVVEEIEGLYARGCRHVILISHRFGERRVGGAAAHPRLRSQSEVLNRLAQSHPDLTVYPLVRDLFYATRLRQREREDAFEILRASDHLAGTDSSVSGDQARPSRRYEPVYSLATLNVVGGRAATFQKPQSGFCTYFLLHDAGMAPAELRVRLEGNLLGDASPVRSSLLGVLRGLHYLEAERSIGGSVQPVLDPYDWMTPGTMGKAGEVLALPPSRRRGGSVGLSLVALLDRTARIAHTFFLPGQGPGAASRVEGGDGTRRVDGGEGRP